MKFWVNFIGRAGHNGKDNDRNCADAEVRGYYYYYLPFDMNYSGLNG